jgi:polysaccharide biosynthesis/export protein
MNGIPFAPSGDEVFTMSKWVRFTSCLLLSLSAMVLSISAQTSKAPVLPVKYAEPFGDGEYRIGPEDVIEVFVWNEEELAVTAVVRPDGKITVKLIGDIVASGKTAKELESEIRTKLVPFIEGAKVNAVVKEINSPKVSVGGEVRKPDVYTIKQKTTVLGAISLAGGLTEYAKKDKIVVMREGPGGQQQFTLKLNDMVRGSNPSVFYVEPGDTIYVK